VKPYAPNQVLTPEMLDAPLSKPVVYGWNRYSEWKPLAVGGTCEIRTALDHNLGRRVAVKTLHKEYENNDVLQRRFVREARITARIQHPNTPPVYEIGRDISLYPYFTMKVVQGKSFQDILTALRDNASPKIQADFPLFRQLEVFTQVALAAAYAHALGIIHRDLKPANIQIGSFGEVILLDWGLAKLIADQEELLATDSGEPRISMELTRAGTRLGTPLYMSPEQASGQTLDTRTDVFSMGIILHELLCKRPLFQGTTAFEVQKEIQEKDIPRPSESDSGYHIPEQLDVICMKALHRDREERYDNLIDLINDLDAYRGKGSISEAPPQRDAPAI